MSQREHSTIGTLLAMPLLIPLAALNLILPSSNSSQHPSPSSPISNIRPLRISFVGSLAPDAQYHVNHWIDVNLPNHVCAENTEDCDFVVLQAPLSDMSVLDNVHMPIIVLPNVTYSPFRD